MQLTGLATTYLKNILIFLGFITRIIQEGALVFLKSIFTIYALNPEFIGVIFDIFLDSEIVAQISRIFLSVRW